VGVGRGLTLGRALAVVWPLLMVWMFSSDQVTQRRQKSTGQGRDWWGGSRLGAGQDRPAAL